jgi:hypothetical protein
MIYMFLQNGDHPARVQASLRIKLRWILVTSPHQCDPDAVENEGHVRRRYIHLGRVATGYYY